MKRLMYIHVLSISSIAFASTPTFFQKALERTSPILSQIERHPFNVELINGCLPKKIFKRYLEQDNHYLTLYQTRGFNLKNKLPHHLKQYVNLDESVSLESKKRDIKRAPRLTPANYNYTRYQLTIDEKESPEVLLAALLPCQWIYQYIYHEKLDSELSANHPYYNWLKVYQTSKYQLTTHNLIELANSLYDQVDKEHRDKMLEAFNQSSLYELQFWEDAYKGNYK